MWDQVSKLITELLGAMSATTLYGPEHPNATGQTSQASRTMQSLYAEGEDINFTLISDSVLFNGERIPLKGLHIGIFADRLRRRGLERVGFKRGISPQELGSLITYLGGLSSEVPSNAHLSVGTMQVHLAPDKASQDNTEARKQVKRNVKKVEDIHKQVSRLKHLDLNTLDDVVTDLMLAMRKEVSLFRAVLPFKFHSEFTFAHITNVAVISLYLAESLGIKGDLLHDVGMAGLLHDMGKMFVSNKILDKEGKLDDDEWNEMRMHTVYGARFLGGISEVPHLSVLAAFEHHMKFDGTGYPQTRMRNRKQHVVSQIIAISDFFDALRAERSYRKPMELEKVIGLLNELSGKDFNPFIVRHFIELVRTSPPA